MNPFAQVQVRSWKNREWIVDHEAETHIKRYGPYRYRWMAAIVAWFIDMACF